MSHVHAMLLPDIEALQQFAARMAKVVCATDVLALSGALGAGKTAFSRFLLQKLGVDGEIPSPTFTLLQTYDAPQFFVTHFDLYRLKSDDELEEIGFFDALAQGLTLIEWPERAGRFLPKNALHLLFGINDDGIHNVTIEMNDAWQSRLGEALL